jgi:PAS domain S-box-containing protein/putative nucleotidyltransferase with HDIG domain
MNFDRAKVVPAADAPDGTGAVLSSRVSGADSPAATTLDERRYRSLVEATAEIVWHTPDSGLFLTDQPGWRRFTGQTTGQLLECRWIDAVHPEDRPDTARTWSEAVAGRTLYQAEHRLLRHDGEYRDMTVRAAPIPDDDGSTREWVGVHTDVTERKRAERALLQAHDELESRVAERTAELTRAIEGLAREVGEIKRADEAQELLASIVESSDDAIIGKSLEGVIRSWNDGAERLFGYTRREAVGQPTALIIPPDRRDEERVILGRLCRGERVEHFETVRVSKDGRRLDISLTISPIRDGEGRVVGASKVGRNITERRQAEASLGRMAAILDATTDFVGMADAEGRVFYVNAAGLKLVGMEGVDVLRTTISDYFSAPVGEFIAKVVVPASIRDGAWSGELALLHRNGCEVPVSIVALSRKDAHGQVEFVSCIARDISERKRAEEEVHLLNSQLERRLNRLNALLRIDTAISSSFDPGFTLGIVLDQVTAQLGVDAADVLLLDPLTRTLRYAIGRGFRTNSMQEFPLELDRSVPGLVASGCKPLHLPDLTRTPCPFVRAEAMEGEGFIAYSAVPLVSQGVVKGVLEVFHRSPLEADEEWLDFLGALAGSAAIAIDSARAFEDLRRSNDELTAAYDATIEGWSKALDLRDKETEGHTRRVTEMAVRLARAMGVGGADLVHVRRGALLHDIGKMGIPDAILLKPGPLTDEERAVMQRHPTYAHEWLSPVEFLRPSLEIPHGHHEKLDGSGYPRGLKGEEIPLAARIFAAVDIWDALRSDRPYRKGWPEAAVVEHIRSLAGTHLDPAVVEAFLGLLDGVAG